MKIVFSRNTYHLIWNEVKVHLQVGLLDHNEITDKLLYLSKALTFLYDSSLKMNVVINENDHKIYLYFMKNLDAIVILNTAIVILQHVIVFCFIFCVVKCSNNTYVNAEKSSTCGIDCSTDEDCPGNQRCKCNGHCGRSCTDPGKVFNILQKLNQEIPFRYTMITQFITNRKKKNDLENKLRSFNK